MCNGVVCLYVTGSGTVLWHPSAYYNELQGTNYICKNFRVYIWDIQVYSYCNGFICVNAINFVTNMYTIIYGVRSKVNLSFKSVRFSYNSLQENVPLWQPLGIPSGLIEEILTLVALFVINHPSVYNIAMNIDGGHTIILK